MKHRILVLNGPRLADLSGYDGDTCRGLTLHGIRDACAALCESLGLALDFRQTEDQDELLRWIEKDSEGFDGVVINPVGRARAGTVAHPLCRAAVQAIARLEKPVIEVRIDNIFSRGAEVIRPVHEPGGATGFVCGLGAHSYLLAIRAIAHRLGASEAA